MAMEGEVSHITVDVRVGCRGSEDESVWDLSTFIVNVILGIAWIDRRYEHTYLSKWYSRGHSTVQKSIISVLNRPPQPFLLLR
jgi:hypothetical protein